MRPRFLVVKLLRGVSRKIHRLSQRVEYWGCNPNIFNYIDCFDTVDGLLKHIHPISICDVGANAGNWTYVLSQMNTSLEHVVLIEPQAEYQEALTALLLPGVAKVIYPCGLGAKPERRWIKGGTASASFLPTDQQFEHFPNSLIDGQEEEVDVMTLDEIYANSNLPIPEVIKIDVQGFELEVLRGGMGILRKARYLVIELSFRQFYKNQPRLWEVLKFLEENQYVMIGKGYEARSWKNPLELVQLDAIFINSNPIK